MSSVFFSSVFFFCRQSFSCRFNNFCFHFSYSLFSLLVSSSSVFACFDDRDWSVRKIKVGAGFIWASVECRKTKAKENTHIWPITTDADNAMIQSERETNKVEVHVAGAKRGKMRSNKSSLVVVFTLHG